MPSERIEPLIYFAVAVAVAVAAVQVRLAYWRARRDRAIRLRDTMTNAQ